MIFAVPKTQCVMLSKGCKITVKSDKIIVSLAKVAESDNWFSLHKVKCIGEKDTDWSFKIDYSYKFDNIRGKIWIKDYLSSIEYESIMLQGWAKQLNHIGLKLLRKWGLEWVRQIAFPEGHCIEYRHLQLAQSNIQQPL